MVLSLGKRSLVLHQKIKRSRTFLEHVLSLREGEHVVSASLRWLVACLIGVSHQKCTVLNIQKPASRVSPYGQRLIWL
jgi:hypothetical protein